MGGGEEKSLNEEASEMEQSFIERVNAVVSIEDDPTLPALTFRVWVMGIAACIIIPFIDQYYNYRKEVLSIGHNFVQILALPIGRLMAAMIPQGRFNPGPFNIKEHVLVTVFGTAAASGSYASHIITLTTAFYNKSFPVAAGILICFTTQILGFGFAGIFKGLLVEPAGMWWPTRLPEVAMFRAFHEPEKRSRYGLSRFQFFIIFFLASAAYSVLPSYLFTTLTTIPILCLIWRKSFAAHHLGSGNLGYGIGAFSFNWATIQMVGNPLVLPFWIMLNMMVGFLLVMYVIIPLLYWKYDIYGTRRIPMFSKKFFDSHGRRYNISKVMNSDLTFNLDGYNAYGHVNLGISFFVFYGVLFAMSLSSITYILLTHGRRILRHLKNMVGVKDGLLDEKTDIHVALMRKYSNVPNWWYSCLFLTTLIVSLGGSIWFLDILQLKWWGVLLGVGIACILITPAAMLQATAGQRVAFGGLCEYMFGYLYPNRPIASVLFKGYSAVTTDSAVGMLSIMKLGIYMKIPPKSLFIAQLVGGLVAALSYAGTAWFLLKTVPHICDTDKLPGNSPWTCPGDSIFYTSSVIWGLIGPQRTFGNLGNYSILNWCFVIGALAPIPVWLLQRAYPKTRWIQYIYVPVIIQGSGLMPYVQSVHYWSWFVTGWVFNYWIFNHKKAWWHRYNYLLASALSAGMALMTLALGYIMHNRRISWWGNHLDQCYLAACPTEPGMKMAGCPVFTH